MLDRDNTNSPVRPCAFRCTNAQAQVRWNKTCNIGGAMPVAVHILNTLQEYAMRKSLTVILAAAFGLSLIGSAYAGERPHSDGRSHKRSRPHSYPVTPTPT